MAKVTKFSGSRKLKPEKLSEDDIIKALLGADEINDSLSLRGFRVKYNDAQI